MYLPICTPPVAVLQSPDSIRRRFRTCRSGSLVLDEELIVRALDERVPAGHGHVVEEDVAVGRAAHRRALLLQEEVLPARRLRNARRGQGLRS